MLFSIQLQWSVQKPTIMQKHHKMSAFQSLFTENLDILPSFPFVHSCEKIAISDLSFESINYLFTNQNNL